MRDDFMFFSSSYSAGVLYTQKCHASKSSAGVYRYKKHTSRPKHRGLKIQDGHFVHAGQVLVKQIGLRYYPGENVRRNCNLFMYFCGPRH